jgi:hypothetical protein
MKQVESNSASRYGESVREQLKAAQHRADLLTLIGMVCMGALLWRNFRADEGAGQWTLASVAIAMLVICLPLWYVTRRKRSISAARLTCRHCGYVPHDTEISEVAETMTCQRCEKPIG